MTTIKDDVYLRNLKRFQDNLYSVGYSGLMRMIVDSSIKRKVLEVLINSKFNKPKTKPNKASESQVSLIYEYGIKAINLNCVEADCLIRALNKVYGEPTSVIVPSGKYKGRPICSVPWKYILYVTDEDGNGYDKDLAMFFYSNKHSNTLSEGSVPCGKFAGKPRSIVPDDYIKIVTDKSSKYYSDTLDEYFNS